LGIYADRVVWWVGGDGDCSWGREVLRLIYMGKSSWVYWRRDAVLMGVWEGEALGAVLSFWPWDLQMGWVGLVWVGLGGLAGEGGGRRSLYLSIPLQLKLNRDRIYKQR
jgi:hypothetical protein